MVTKAKPRKTDSDTYVPEPAWKQQRPAKRRPKVRQTQAVVTRAALEGSTALPRLPAIHLPRLNQRQLAVLPLVVFLMIGSVVLFTNDRFFVFEPQVRGNQRVSAEQIFSQSGVEGKSIFWVEPSDVAQKVAQVPGVETATAHVRLPNQVIIDVAEELPLVAWKTDQQEVWIGEDGWGMPSVGAPPPLILSDSSGTAAAPATPDPAGDTRQPVDGVENIRLRPQLLVALSVLHDRRPDLKDLYYGSREGIYFRAPQGWTVYLGEDGDMAAKLALLDVAQQRLAGEQVAPKVVDLRQDNEIIYH